MSKNIKIDARTHVRLKKKATEKGRLIGHLASEMLNVAMDSEKSTKGGIPHFPSALGSSPRVKTQTVATGSITKERGGKHP